MLHELVPTGSALLSLQAQVVTQREAAVPTFVVTTVHDCGTGEVVIDAASAKEAVRLAKQQASVRVTWAHARKVGDKHVNK